MNHRPARASSAAQKETSKRSLTHRQIAALVGTSRETCTVLRGFAHQHLIRLAQARIALLAPERLTDHAG